VDPAYRFDAPGLLALSHDSAGWSGSQFFITYAALPEMDGQFTIIGRIRSGMEVLNSFRPRNPETDEILLPAEALISVTIKEE
jgi:cyclophilin family peptidyl-prolyl cis-trans isomerase